MKLIFLIGLFLLTACTPKVEEITPSQYSENAYVFPEELKDCKGYRLRPSCGIPLFVIRCPNSQTSVTTGDKGSTTTVTIEN